MTSERKTCTIWTCDVCQHVETVDDTGSGYGRGWFQVASAPVTAKLGNTPARDLCPHCADNLRRMLARTLGDVGDMAEAWDAGHIAGSMIEYDGRKTNPYRSEADR